MNKSHEMVRAIADRDREKLITADGRKARKHYSDGTEKRPGKASGWFESRTMEILIADEVKASSFSVWARGGVDVISARIRAEAPDGTKEIIPQWHLSAGRADRRCNDAEIRQVLASFGMVGAEEDNHHPGGQRRHFFLTVDPARRRDCECKEDERVIVEPDGYRSTTPKDGPCSGCDLAATKSTMGAPATCPLHPGGPSK